MKYMLDTNICIFIIKNKPENVIKKFMKHEQEDICISSITYAELVHGVEKSQAKEQNRIALMLFLSEISIIPFDNFAVPIFSNTVEEKVGIYQLISENYLMMVAEESGKYGLKQ